jgi:hypothetical protein
MHRLFIDQKIPTHVLPILRGFVATHSQESMENSLVILAENKVRIRRWQ